MFNRTIVWEYKERVKIAYQFNISHAKSRKTITENLSLIKIKRRKRHLKNTKPTTKKEQEEQTVTLQNEIHIENSMNKDDNFDNKD